MLLDSYQTQFLALLLAYTPYDEIEAGHWQRTLDFLQATPSPFSRQTLGGHITASGVVVDEQQEQVLLIWHEKHQGWFQPGGHCEPEDPTTPLAALREVVEETEIPAEQFQLWSEAPFDIDVHPIPARGEEPAHWHYDIRYRFRCERAALRLEAGRAQWRPIIAVQQDPDPSRSRFAAKLLKR
jgi:8-oxo-dGTP pyrophosphatase MutT (NUDIX family)